jgi:sodium-dependent dicarboxylate transporter 2/3/5
MGGIATPVGTPPNLIGVRALADAGHDIGFVRWMTVGLPVAVVMLVVMWAVLALVFRLRKRDARLALPPVAPAWKFTAWTRLPPRA